jgi:hypothetical protein
MPCTAYYRNRKGASCIRRISNAAEAEKLLSGGYQCVQARIVHDESGAIVGRRYREHGLDRNLKYIWFFDASYFQQNACQKANPATTPQGAAQETP